jgi:hypothetical protein
MKMTIRIAMILPILLLLLAVVSVAYAEKIEIKLKGEPDDTKYVYEDKSAYSLGGNAFVYLSDADGNSCSYGDYQKNGDCKAYYVDKDQLTIDESINLKQHEGNWNLEVAIIGAITLVLTFILLYRAKINRDKRKRRKRQDRMKRRHVG